MKICHIMTRYVRGGADENTLLSCNGQVESGHDVHFLFGNDAHHEMIAALSPAVKWLQIVEMQRAINPVMDLIALWKITQYLRKNEFDLVHTHASKAGVLGRLAGFLARTPVIIHGIHILPFINVGAIERFAYLWIERRLSTITHAFISVGQGMRDEAMANGVGKPCQHHVIESGMDLQRFRTAVVNRLDWRAVIPPGLIEPVADGEPLFLILVSRFERRKRQVEFLDVFAELLKDYPNLRLLIVGEGPDKDQILSRICGLSLEGKAVICGYRNDVERLMAISHVGLLTSEREGLARVLIQYALVQLPIVSTDIPGVREIVDPRETGLLVPTYELHKMRLAIGELLNDGELYERIRHNQSKMVFDRWSIAEMNSRILNVYSSCLGKTDETLKKG